MERRTLRKELGTFEFEYKEYRGEGWPQDKWQTPISALINWLQDAVRANKDKELFVELDVPYENEPSDLLLIEECEEPEEAYREREQFMLEKQMKEKEERRKKYEELKKEFE